MLRCARVLSSLPGHAMPCRLEENVQGWGQRYRIPVIDACMSVFRAGQYMSKTRCQGRNMQKERGRRTRCLVVVVVHLLPGLGSSSLLFASSLCPMKSPIFNHRHHSRQGGLSKSRADG